MKEAVLEEWRVPEIDEALKEHLWVGALEDYIRCAEFGHYAKDQEAHYEEMRSHLDKLCLLVQDIKKTEYQRGFENGKNDIFKMSGTQPLSETAPLCSECMLHSECGSIIYTKGHCPRHTPTNPDKQEQP